MTFIFEILQEYPSLAKQEVLSLIKNPLEISYDKQQDIPFLFVKNDLSKTQLAKLAKRLALTKKIGKLIFVTKQNNLLKKIKYAPWKRLYRQDICIRARGSLKDKEKELAKRVISHIPKASINLTTPTTKIEFICLDHHVYALQILHEVRHDFDKRKAQNRPALHPSSTHPKIARAMINLSGIEGKNKSILDPFVGSGGILLEAEDMGYSSEGFDIDDEMIDRCKKNLAFFRTKKAQIKKQDATTFKQKVEYVVSDLPYGKMTKNIADDLYDRFFKNLRKRLKKRAVLCFLDKKENIDLLKKHNFKILHLFSLPVHTSMTRVIAVVEK